MDCPRCKTSFFVEKTVAGNWKDTLSDCPVCGFSTFSDERFDICPKCGLDVKKHNEEKRKGGSSGAVPTAPNRPTSLGTRVNRAEQELLLEEARRKLADDSSKRKYGLDMAPNTAPHEPVAIAPVPQAIQIIGWVSLAVAALMLILGLKDFYQYVTMAPPEPDPVNPEGVPGSSMLFFMHGLLPLLTIIFAVAAGTCSYMFLQLRSWARQKLEWVAWGGIGIALIHEIAGLVGWIRRSSSEASLIYYAVGFISTLLMMLLWTAPVLLLIWFLRSDKVTGEFDL